MPKTNSPPAPHASPALGVAGAAAEVLRALTALGDEITSAELAATLKLGRSTVDKALAALESRGLATRRTGAAQKGQRQAAHWTAAAPEPTPRGRARRAAAPAAVAPPGRARQDTGTTRLRPGQLREQVLDFLRAQPAGTGHTPGRIGRALGRSSGAVANACDRLTATGQAILAADTPRAFAAAAPAGRGRRAART